MKKRGFTLVELLIAIVVIAILASISVVAYNGIQTRASNIANISAADQYRKAFALYVADNGKYPYPAVASICLGDGYPDKNGDGIGDCVVTASGVVSASIIDKASDMLLPYMSNRPNLGGGKYIQRPLASPDNQFFVTSQVRYSRVPTAVYNGVVTENWLIYLIQGVGNDCQRPLSVTSTSPLTFVDAAQSPGINVALKECYEPLPNV